MNKIRRAFLTALLPMLLLTGAAPGVAAEEPQELVVSIYHVAPGRHVEFLRWMAAQENVARDVGLPPTRWYVHENGDSWDYLALAPLTTEEQDRAFEEEAKKKRVKTGFPAGLELRQYLTAHTDTFVLGPMSAADILDLVAQ